MCRNISPSIVEPDLACATITTPTGDVTFPAAVDEEEPSRSINGGMSLATAVSIEDSEDSSSGSSNVPGRKWANGSLVVLAHAPIPMIQPSA